MPSFSDYYWAGRRGHLIGVGGVSMSPLAEVLAEAGLSPEDLRLAALKLLKIKK